MTAIRKTGDEKIAFAGMPVGYTLRDFWSWTASDLLSNTLRGEYAEFIVAAALRLDLSAERVNWEPWDLTYHVEGREVHIEVKSSSYLQAWAQQRPSAIQFSIRPTRLLSEDGQYADEVRRRSDVYVFCVYAEKVQEKADPLRLDGWEFYILPTRVLDENCGSQKTIGLAALQRLGPVKSDYNGIEAAVRQCIS